MTAEWYYARQGNQLGPVAWEALCQLVASGSLQPTDLVWRQGMPAWAPAQTIQGLFPGAGSPLAATQTVAKMRLFTPKRGDGMDRLFGVSHFTYKVYLDGKLLGEAKDIHGFDYRLEPTLGSHILEVVKWDDGEADRKKFVLKFTKAGIYEIRFNYVWEGGGLGFFAAATKGNMQKSTLDILREPA